MAKLIDILARELKEWPVVDTGCDSITQDDDGALNATMTGRTPSIADGVVWKASSSLFFANPKGEDYRTEVAEDFATAIVTREQWQAAVDALKAPTWDGEGLPPVGTVCEFRGVGTYGGWQRVEILLHFQANSCLVAVFYPLSGDRVVSQAVACCFRPIKTAEQIAAEEREAAVKEMLQTFLDFTGSPFDSMAAVYDAIRGKQ